MSTKAKETPQKTTLQITGHVRWAEKNEAISGAVVNLYVRESGDHKPIGTGTTDQAGRCKIRVVPESLPQGAATSREYYFVVLDAAGRILLSTQDTPMRLHQQKWDVDLRVPEIARMPAFAGRERPQIRAGSLLMNADPVAKATPEDVLNVARLLRKQRISDASLKRIEAISPDLVASRLTRRTLSTRPIFEAIDVLIRQRNWPRELALEFERILRGSDLGYATLTYDTANFHITYYDAGVDAVDPDTSAQDVTEPGSTPGVVIDTLPAGGPPTYVKRVAYWLEKALNKYVSAPFSMLSPAAAGKIPVYVLNYAFGGATPTGFYIDKDLPDDIVCAVSVHELFHMVQFQYPGTGTWLTALREGGAVVAEDAVADLMNRYLDEAGTNFNGVGTQSNTNRSLFNASYKACLFWRYIAEQMSSDLSEPLIGVETYRKIVERCSAGSWSTEDLRAAIRELPWHQDLYQFSYLDLARLDRTSSETVLGNYALACYLKDVGTNLPDRRFDFMEDEEEIRIDDILHDAIDPTLPLQTTLAPVTLSGSGIVTPAASVAFAASVNDFAHRYYEVAIDGAVTNIEVQFTAGGGLIGSIFQMALIDEDGKVRDIHRSDAANYTKRVTNLRDGKQLSRIALVVSGAGGSGPFNMQISNAAAAPDVMVTRWHSALKTEYEIDSRGWAWTWVSPDVWVDNDADGIADGVVLFDYDNKLHIRLHNKGNAVANNIQVELFYQDAAGGLSPTAWLPVKNKAGVTQLLTGLTLAAGASNDWTVDWSPLPSGLSKHFCVRAIVTVPGDPNTDNKRLLSNFFKVIVAPGKFVDIKVLRRNPFPVHKLVSLHVVSRLPREFKVSLYDIKERGVIDIRPGESVVDVLRIEHTKVAHHFDFGDGRKPFNFEPIKRTQIRPDPLGTYKTDSRALPPGVARQPMVTVFYEVDGRPIGGMTVLVGTEK
jgi:hypothetical protein